MGMSRRSPSPSPSLSAVAPAGSVSGIRAPGQFIPGHGPLPSPILLVGERPGETEAQLLMPFVGPSGEILNRWLDTADLSRDACRVTNVCRDYLPGNPAPRPWEIDRDTPKLLTEIQECGPFVIGAVGAFAVHWFLGDGLDMDTVHGVPHYWPRDPRIIVVPIYHPAASFHKPDLAAKGQYDVFVLAACLRDGLKPIADTIPDSALRYTESRNDLLGFPIAPSYLDRDIAIDTEGSIRRPWCLTASDTPGEALLIKPDTISLAAFRHALSQFISAGGIVSLHNAMHDLGVLRAMGIVLPRGSFTDTMVMAFLLCLEPQGLKPLAYRHARMMMSSYEELVHEPNRQHALAYILTAWAMRDQWPETEPYLLMERDKSTNRLVPKIKRPWHIARYLNKLVADYDAAPDTTDLRARWHNIDDYIRRPVELALGRMPEATLDDVEPEKALVYACRDADATHRIRPVLSRMIDAMGMREVLDIDLSVIPLYERMQSNGFRASRERFDRFGEKLTAEMERLQSVITSLTGANINPDSSDQVADLLFGQLGLRSRKKTDTGKNSTGNKVIQDMLRDHPVVLPIHEYRVCSHLKSAYCDPISQLIEPDGRIRCTLNITRVASGRLSSKNPNLLGIPVRTALGKELRSCFVAEPGCTLATWDWNQIEMRLMAHISQDPNLLHAFRTGIDIHTQTASLMFGKSMANVAKHERQCGKTVGFGVINGMTEKGLVDQFILFHATKNGLPLGEGGEPWTESDCRYLLVEWFRIYRNVKTMMRRAAASVRATGYARDMWGRIRYLPNIHSDRPWMREEAERQASNFEIQSGAKGLIKVAEAQMWDALTDYWRMGTGLRLEPLLDIHDETVWEMSDDPELKDYWSAVMDAVMCHSTTLSVPIAAGHAFGDDWGSLEK